MNKPVFFIVTILALFINAETSFSQTKFGYVSSETILKELPEAQDAQKKLEIIVKNWQDEFEKMKSSLQAKVDDYKRQEAMIKDESTKQQKQRALLEEEQKIQQYYQEKFSNQGELAFQREKMMTPIKEKIFKAIKEVAKKEKLSMVFDKAGDIVLLYADENLDYTFKVLDNLKRGK
ncbi:MAG: OmpH family outer membrane protein [Bacteroidota bacterium]